MRAVVSWLMVLLVVAEQEEQGKQQGRGHGQELERFTRKGKLVTQETGGDIHVELRRKRWGDEKERLLCCALASHHCRGPCGTASCAATCSISCGFLSFWQCAPISCATAAASTCTPATSCGTAGTGTLVGTKCYTYTAAPTTWLDALTSCLAAGGALAKIESAAEQTAAIALTGGTNTWIGLSDISTEGTFTWADGAALGSYTAWSGAGGGQPTSDGVTVSDQHCVQLRAVDGEWNDVKCAGPRAYICQT